MSTEFYIGAAILAVVYFGWMAYEVWRAPMMPDDYGLTDEEKKIMESIEKETGKKITEANGRIYTIKGKKYLIKKRKNNDKNR